MNIGYDFVGATGFNPVMNDIETINNNITTLNTSTANNFNSITTLQDYTGIVKNLIGTSLGDTQISNIIPNKEIRFINDATGRDGYKTKIDSNGKICYYHTTDVLFPNKPQGWYNIHNGLATIERDFLGFQVNTENRFVADELSMTNLQTQMGAYDLAQNATIASIVGGTGGAGALALLAYNQVQTKNPIITWTAPLLYNTSTNTASFDSSYKLCKSYSLPLNYDNNNNLSINNIEVVSTIATLTKNGSTVNPTLVSGNTYQYIYNQSGTITFNVDTPITLIDTQANILQMFICCH